MTSAVADKNLAPTSLGDIKRIFAEFPSPNLEALTALSERMVKTPDAVLTRLQSIAEQATRWGTGENDMRRPRVAVYLAGYDGLQGDQAALDRVQALADGTDPLNGLCQSVDSDLRLYELAPELPTNGLSEEEAAHAISYGMMAVEAGVDALSIASFSKGAETAAEKILSTLKTTDDDSLDLLCQHGGRDLAAMVGVLMAARLAKLPVVLEGVAALAAAYIVEAQQCNAAAHCFLAAELPSTADGLWSNDFARIPAILPEMYYSEMHVAAPLALQFLRAALKL